MPADARDAFYQLVLYPVKACAIVNDLYVTVGQNRLYAVQGRASTNDLAERARVLFRQDEALSREYNETLAGGKWNHMMDQTHIGYTYWQQPVRNAMPAVQEIQVPPRGEMGLAVEGSEASWPGGAGAAGAAGAERVRRAAPLPRDLQPRAAAVRRSRSRPPIRGCRSTPPRAPSTRPADLGERATGRSVPDRDRARAR